MNNAETRSPWGGDSIAVHLFSLRQMCWALTFGRVVSFNNFFNGQKSSIYRCFLELYGPKLQLPWLKQTLDIPTPEYNVFSEEMSLWSHRLWKSTFWQEICHPLKLHKIQIAKRKLKTSHRWGFEPITCHVWDKPFYSWMVRWFFSGFVARPYD